MELLEVEIHAATDIGRCRKGNEDNYLLLQLSTSEFLTKSKDSNDFVIQSPKFEVDAQGIVLAVSDGCGGALAGDLSSSMVVESVRSMLTNEVPSLDDSFYEGVLIEKLYDATLYANRLIHHEGRINPELNGMGCTLTAVGVTPDTCDFIQVGDSRGYLIRKDKIYQITKDQTLANQLIDKGEITPEEAETHWLKNVILHALGAMNEVYPVAVRLIPNRDDILLLCSDGLSNKLTAENLVQLIWDNFNDLKKACRSLIEEANEKGGEDNITVILAKLSGNALMEQTDEPIVIYPLIFSDTDDANKDMAENI